MRGDAHSGEKLRALRFVEKAEQDSRHPTFAIVLMRLNPRMMIVIGHRTLANLEAKQACTAFGGLRYFGILDACYTRHH